MTRTDNASRLRTQPERNAASLRRYPPELVIKTNQVFHDTEGDTYRRRHPEIFEEEGARWRRIARRFLAGAPSPLRILDIGSGTGFVPSVIAPFLKERDLVVCSDISETLLACCRKQLAAENHACEFQFRRLSGNGLPFADAAFDVVTLNSVVHHIPLLEPFFSETSRVLKDQGRLLIGHEPHRPFYRDRWLWPLSQACESLFQPRVAAARLLKISGIEAVLRLLRVRRLLRGLYLRMAPERRNHDSVLDAINARLLQEGVIETPLGHEEIVEMVDIHSPTAGVRVAPDRGFDPQELMARYLPCFEAEHLETYNHLGAATALNRVTRRLDALLRRRYPKRGATLFVVLRKSTR
jgi:SAM-dependent methyltransferase